MAKEPFLPVLRELARCYQAFEAYSAAHVRTLDLTPPQFDIVVTLGNTPGMSFKELGSRTLITKGTLTGVVDRLEARGLVNRLACPHDGRSMLVRLTPEGDALFQRIFEPHIAFLAPAFESLPECGRKELEKRLKQLREALEKRYDARPTAGID